MLRSRISALLFLIAASSCGGDDGLDGGVVPGPLIPPFAGTVFVGPDIITESDPTTFVDITPMGGGTRTVFDRRVDAWVTLEMLLFDARFDDGPAVVVQVNPELGEAMAALETAERYARVIGRLPRALRRDVETVTIHDGVEPFGGGNRNILIHDRQGTVYERDEVLEEVLVHEAAHTSLDADHAAAPGWLSAQAADANFISTYARDFPDREDVAESFLLYLAVRHRGERVSSALAATIVATIPNRIAYFDAQAFDVRPVAPTP